MELLHARDEATPSWCANVARHVDFSIDFATQVALEACVHRQLERTVQFERKVAQRYRPGIASMLKLEYGRGSC